MYMSKNYINNQGTLSELVIDMMNDVVLLLNHYGITEIPASNVMRLLGVPEDEATKWDNAMLSVDEEGKLVITNKGDDDFENPFTETISSTLH